MEIAAPYALRLFGPAYVIKDYYVSIRRAEHRMTHAASIMAIGTAVEVAGSVVGGALWGLNAICLGWVIGASGEALFLLSPVLEVFRRVPAIDSDAGSESD